MKIFSGWSTAQNTAEAGREAWKRAGVPAGEAANFIVVFATESYDLKLLDACLRECAGQTVPILGGTSCQGVMTEQGFHSENGRGLGILVLCDPRGRYGVGGCVLGDDPQAAGARALEAALENAGCPGEMPDLVWMVSAPGTEEDVLAGLEALVGAHVPVTGGSSADNAIAGNWQQVAGGEVFDRGVVIGVLFPSTAIGSSFHSGYDPGACSGRVTKAEGRTLLEIDGRPAAQVYNEWTNGGLAKVLPGSGNILGLTTLQPLGRCAGFMGKVPYYKLSHPETVTPAGGMTLFSRVNAGDEIVLMQGSRESLLTRAGRVMAGALGLTDMTCDQLAGALVVYCAGCMLTVQSEMPEVVRVLNEEGGNKPFLGIFTFGEQGFLCGKENTHGNLMISVTAFSR